MRLRLQQQLGSAAIRSTRLPLALRRCMTQAARIPNPVPAAWCVNEKKRAVFAINRKVASRSWLVSMGGAKATQKAKGHETIYREIVLQMTGGPADTPYDAWVGTAPQSLCSDLDRYFHFGVVRNPFERFASYFADKLAKGADYEREILLGTPSLTMPFLPARAMLVEAADLPDLPDPQRMELFLERLRGTDFNKLEPHVRVQSRSLQKPNGQDLDMVTRYENMAADAAAIQKRCGIELSVHLNRNGGTASWQDLYTPKSLRLVAEMYREDIEKFHYEWAYDELRSTVLAAGS